MWDYNEDETALDERGASAITDGTDADDDFADTDILDSEEMSDSDAYKADGPIDDFIGDNSVVFDVDDLVAEFEAEGLEDSSASARLRRRLEAIAERKRRHNDLVDFADYDLDV